ncbi:ABC transporter substrate-binding protein [Cryobacterium roopkundense]|uniref:ABC transporter substrate-binding protein n=1 Tax=Cryobacterium roopkundense TaxID=1001240 RepID=A0A099JLL3_9MICO|nr:ABC transporter substrate-binding protein [Cryobacterium roopkundense]KGJ78373.1 ABC transporter substrate-binding protein [Cryobacterium roopkundense]MBB5639991.1 peptide/nickel transport system substrate-binding protein [Cryobacterium roopkundense]
MPRPLSRLTTRRTLWIPLLAAGLALSTTACQAQQLQTTPESSARVDVTSAPIGDQTIIEGGDFVMALSAEPDRLDPTTSSSLYTRYVMQTVCEKLYDLDANGAIVPQLATDLPEFSADGLTVTIPVRTDAVFADGTDFTAEAVATTIERHLTLPASSRTSELGPITAVTATDVDHVQITYSEPFAPITAALADRAGMIMSPQALAETGDSFGDSPVCVGPYKFVERVPQTSITVERDPMYYDARSVHLDTITDRIMTDSNIRAANLRSGDVHAADSISPQDVGALSNESGIGILQVGSLGYQGITINMGNTDGIGSAPGVIDTPMAQDTSVREALSMSVDREALVSSVFNDWYEPACSPVSPASPFTSALSEECPAYDPEGAQRLLEEAGVELPYAIDMLVSNNPDTLRFAQALQASVSDGGFELTISPVEYSTLLDLQTRGEFDALQLGWSGRVDPHGNMFNFLSTGGGNNYSGYSNADVDTLLADAAATTDVSHRADLYGQAVAQVQEDNPIVYLYRQRSLTAYSTDIAGIHTFADGVVHLSDVAFVEGE